MISSLLYVPIHIAQRPITGECLVGHWWIVHPENGLPFSAVISGRWASTVPHSFAKETEADCRVLQEHIFQDHEIMRIPVVYLEHAVNLMTAVREQVSDEEKKARKKVGRKGKKAQASPIVNSFH